MSFDRRTMLELLPAVYRLRDAELRREGEDAGPLEALINVLSEQAQVVEADIARLYDDQFIETCAEWVVPYIADLVGARGFRSVDDASFSARSFVANTIAYRRRKGTAAILEQIARDVTGWDAAAVELFEKLVATQFIQNHIRPHCIATVDLRKPERLQWLNTPFESQMHIVDVRRIAGGRGRYNIPNVGVFLWRVAAYPLTGSTAFAIDATRFTFDPLGRDVQLFQPAVSEADIGELARPANVPLPISRRSAAEDRRAFYGPSFSVDGVALADVVICDLSAWSTTPAAGKVHIDPLLGRIAFGTAPATPLKVDYHYGFTADMGGGEYEREASFAVSAAPTAVGTAAGALKAALDPLPAQRELVFELDGSATHIEHDLKIQLQQGQRVEIRARNGKRPVLKLNGKFTIEGDADAELYLNGFLIAGGELVVPAGQGLARLDVRHCTIAPGEETAIRVGAQNTALQVAVADSIVGGLRVPSDTAGLTLRDSIVEAPRRLEAGALLSGDLTGTSLTSRLPAVSVTLGGVRKNITFGRARFASGIQFSLRNLGPEGAFTRALVIAARNRLAIVSGDRSTPLVEASGTNPSAAQLKLIPPDAVTGRAIVGTVGGDEFTFRNPNPRIIVTVNGVSRTIPLTAGPVNIAEGQIDAALAQAPPLDAFASLASGPRIVFVPTAPDTVITVAAPAGDTTTLEDLGLDPREPAICGEARETDPGPATTIERCTIFGPVHVKELTLASEVIFDGRLLADRTQTGCVRFSYVPPGSRTPRRYRCQPDLEIELRSEPLARLIAPASDADLQRLARQLGGSLVPSYTSTRHGDPGYAQLALVSPVQIRTGAEDGSEMGAFQRLQQPRREANLRSALEEYLRFGLEAGVFYAS
jgi:hypothetical protein